MDDIFTAIISKDLKGVQKLIHQVNSKNGKGYTSLQCAVLTKNLEICTFLVSNGADINGQNRDGRTALHFAAGSGDLDICIFLISKGADLSLGNEYGNMALHIAALFGHVEICKLLMDNQIVNTKNNAGCTPLHYAAHHPSVYQLLMKIGQTKEENNHGSTASDIVALRQKIDSLMASISNVDDKTVNVTNRKAKDIAELQNKNNELMFNLYKLNS